MNDVKTSSYLYIILIIFIIGVAVLLFLPEDTNTGGNQGGNNGTQIVNPGGNTNPGGSTNPGGNDNPGGNTGQDVPSTLILTLKGETNIKLQKGEKYEEPGYTATDSIEGDLTSKVTTTGKVDTSKVGSYHIIYKVENTKGDVKQAIRIVNVSIDASDAKIKITAAPTELTNKDVTVTLKITGEGYDYTTLPDGKKDTKANITYKISKNGTYTFKIKRKDGKTVKKEIKVANIDKTKPTVACKNAILSNKSIISVTANDDSGIMNYNYTIDSKKYASKENTYTISGSHKSVSVTVYDKASNYTIASCINYDYIWPVSKKLTTPETTPQHYEKHTENSNMSYLLYYPDDLDLNKQKNSLVIFLHGAGMGKYLSAVGNTTFGKNMRTGRFKGAVFLAPKCGNVARPDWRACGKILSGIIDDVVKKYNIDTKRISITGHSDGGAGVYTLLDMYPERFSAAAILAGSPGAVSLVNIKKNKIVVFYGSQDHNYKMGTGDADYYRTQGVDIKLYTFPGVDHTGITRVAYEEYNVVEWLINQSR